MQDISVIILTQNEEQHIARCIKSLLPFTDKIFVVDSGSTDNTIEIVENLGAKTLFNKWVNHSTQINVGIAANPFNTKWLMRIDADEYVLPELAEEINQTLHSIPDDTTGLYVKRRVFFMNKWIKHGGYYPIWLLRLWRNGAGICEDLWMDEHIKLLHGKAVQLKNDIVDNNLNNLTWWIQKHNQYAILEMIVLLDTKYNFTDAQKVEARLFGTQDQRKRYLKLKYANLPLFTRPFVYFIFRFVFKLGFLDGTKGLIWHFLQGLWYRFLVDAKMYEMYHRVGKDRTAIIDYFKTEYGKDLLKLPNRPVEV